MRVDVEFDNSYSHNTISEMYASGFNSYNPSFFWVLKYDAANSIFSAAYTPAIPRDFLEYCNIIVTPSKNAQLSYAVYWYKFKG
ncbi:hypothetical protein DRO97_10630 [Archaeoglobales archaeon]|nr:MAG: hypothetical protein DRO97_10630 [Archaeoglobales archaeon]